MTNREKIQEEARIKYQKRLEELQSKSNPNYIEIAFLEGVIKRIENGKLFT